MDGFALEIISHLKITGFTSYLLNKWKMAFKNDMINIRNVLLDG